MIHEVVYIEHCEASRLLRDGLPTSEAQERSSELVLNTRGSKGTPQPNPACPEPANRDANAWLKA